MNGLPMLVGWLFFAVLGGAVGFAIGWMCCNVSWHRYQARRAEADKLRPEARLSPERLKAAGEQAMREMRERHPEPVVSAQDLARAMAAPSYRDEFSGCGAEPLPPTTAGCHCEACVPMDIDKPETIRMIVCSQCGNKRCPHANDHRNGCTNSNELGQKGSSWEHVKPAGAGSNGARHG